MGRLSLEAVTRGLAKTQLTEKTLCAVVTVIFSACN
jgi:hypothetical protein